MKRSTIIISALVFAHLAAIPVYAEMGGRGMGMMRHSMIRHRYYMMHGIPSQYRGRENPLPVNEEIIAEGRRLYMGNCASCHGQKGFGDGPAGKELDPPASDISSIARMPMASDSYLFWTISEGGADLNTAMPAFKDTLGSDRIWKIILFLRSGFQ